MSNTSGSRLDSMLLDPDPELIANDSSLLFDEFRDGDDDLELVLDDLELPGELELSDIDLDLGTKDIKLMHLLVLLSLMRLHVSLKTEIIKKDKSESCS